MLKKLPRDWCKKNWTGLDLTIKMDIFFKFLTEMATSKSYWNTNFPRCLPKTSFYHPEYPRMP